MPKPIPSSFLARLQAIHTTSPSDTTRCIRVQPRCERPNGTSPRSRRGYRQKDVYRPYLNAEHKMAMPKIAIIVSTTREGRFGDKPAQWIFRLAKARGAADFEIVDLRDYPLPL